MTNSLVNKNNKVAIIHYDKDFYFSKQIRDRGIHIIPAFKNTNVITRLMRKIHYKLDIRNQDIWFDNNIKRLHEYDCLIVFDAAMKADYINKLRLLYPNKRIILWYWNPLRNSIPLNAISDSTCEKWSYSLEDCKKYNLRYNSTFYFKELACNYQQIKHDVLFIGRDKGRLQNLLRYKDQLEKYGLETYFHISPTKWYLRTTNKIYKKDITYDKVIDKIMKSKSILDIVQNPNDGLTLRAMESIFHKRKLITNCKTVKKYKFYDPNNVFLLGEDDMNSLKSFVESPYVNHNEYQEFDFGVWLSRFQDYKC